jgi:PAS domain S-box-containing protein
LVKTDAFYRSDAPVDWLRIALVVSAVVPILGFIIAAWYDLSASEPAPLPGNLAMYGVVAAFCAVTLSAISWIGLHRARALRQSEARYRTLYERTPVPMHRLDRDGRVLSVSDFWLEMMGYSREEVIGRYIYEFQTGRSAAQFRTEIWPRTLAHGGIRQIEREYVTKDGSIVHGLLSSRVELDDAGAAADIHAVIVDITSLKRVEQELRREKELSGFLLKSSTEGIVGTDTEFRVTLWNPAMEAMTGFAPRQALGRMLFDLFPHFSGTSIEIAWRDTLAGKTLEVRDRTYVMPRTGKRGYYEARYAPLYGEDGAIIGATALVRDTTERHAMEEALRQSQKMEAVGQLTGGIAHDFNNLLTAIIGNLQLVDDMLPDDEPRLKRQIGAAQRAADRGARLTSQLLAFSRRQTLRPEIRDLNGLIHEVDNLTQRAAGEAITTRFNLQQGLWLCRVDPAQFEAAILNVVVNARDAMTAGGTVTIETANVAVTAEDGQGMQPGDYVRVSISDTGIGMSPEILARASEPFFTTKEVGKGTGLGLSMVYGFIQQSGGELRIESEPGAGTRIDMYLPRSLQTAEHIAVNPTPQPEPATRAKILVVDDDLDVRETVTAVLRTLGYDVLTVANGVAALEIVRGDGRIDLLFSDIIMGGGMTGIELARAVRQDHPQVNILLTSGFPVRGAHGMSGGDEFPTLTKPYRREVLAEAVRSALGQSVL